MPALESSRRILLAIDRYQPDHGGAAEWLRHYASWLAERGHDVVIACERADAAAPESCKLLTLPPAQHTKNSWKRALALQAIVRNASADLVHDTGCLPAADIFHPLMGSLIHNWRRQLQAFPPSLRVRRLFHVRLWRDVRLQWHQRRRHRILVACSRLAAADFARLGCRGAIVIPNGIPAIPCPAPETIHRLRAELGATDRVLALVTATNFYLKGVMTVIDALARLDSNARKKLLVVVTGHNHDPAFQGRIDRLALRDCCRLVGWVPDIAPYYAAADIFLHPTWHDAGSLSTLKALAAGCAVVTSRFDGSADFIEHGIDGLVLGQPGNAIGLAELLQRLLDPATRERFRAAARKLGPSLSQENQFAKLEALYGPVRTRPALRGMKNVLAFTLGAEHPSARLRIAAYAGAFEQRGWRLKMHPFDPGMGKSLPRGASWWKRALHRWHRARRTARAAAALHQLDPAEPIIISRELPVSRGPFLHAPNPIVLDIDDALYLGSGRDRLHELCRCAQVVVCGNKTIAAELSPVARRCVVIPTVVDTDRYRVRTDYRLGGPLRAGWLGSSMSIEETLAPLLPMLAEIRKQTAFELIVISDDAPEFLRQLGWVRFLAWTPEREQSIADHTDVGLMPLQDNPYQAGKCGAKLVQYMASGLPSIASPIGVNADLVTDGVTGFHATGPEAWARALEKLATQEKLRATLGRAARERAVRDFSVARYADEWIAVLDSLAA